MSAVDIKSVLKKLSIKELNPGWSTGTIYAHTGHNKEVKMVFSPIDSFMLGEIEFVSETDYDHVVKTAQTAFEAWKKWPAPKRGEIGRQIGEELRKYKQELGTLVTLEMGKTLQEGLGEVQEMIDVCDFAVGMSRQLCGQTMHSERPNHRMYEQYHPLGIVGIISAFNFPVQPFVAML